MEDYLFKAEQFNEAVHNISNQAVFEIRGNKEKIVCCFFGEKPDIEIIDSSFRNYNPHAITEISTTKPVSENYCTYVFAPNAPFYKSLNSFRLFKISPVNIIPSILFNIEKKNQGIFQIIFSPLPGKTHEIVEEAIDIEWQALLGADRQVKPSLQDTTKSLEYKSPDFQSYYAVSVRMFLPIEEFLPSVKAFIANYTYGSKSFSILDNRYYSQEQITQMLNERVSFQSGWLLNTHELTGFLHIPYQILNDKNFTGCFAAAPVGDKPVKTAEYKGIEIGTWAC
jgi:hypothetical protein